jgi:gas vesicle protein
VKSQTQSSPPYGFVVGLAAGMFVGAGLTLWLSPRVASELRERINESAKSVGQRASDHYQEASNRVGDAVEALTRPRAL